MDPLAQYIVRNYAPLMRPAEAAAHQRLMLTNRATGGDTSPEAQERVTSSPVNRRQYPDACADDPTMLALASVGLYGIVSYAVSQRTREVGIRMSLGADGGSVIRMLMQSGLKLVAVGGVIGLLLAVGLSQAPHDKKFGPKS